MKPKTLLAIVVLVVLPFVFVPLLTKLHSLKQQNVSLKAEVAKLSAQEQLLSHELELLKEDPVYIEHVARKTFGKAKEGEIVYKLVSPE
jgi:cell division protein DivIC